MLKEITELKTSKSDKTTRELYRYFQKRYHLGALAVVEAITIASLKVTNKKSLSLLIISPSGQMKSQVMNEIINIFNETSILIPSRFTPYGLSQRMGKPRLDNRTWLINDMVRTFDGLSQVKISELVGWLSEMISEQKSGSMTAQEAELHAKMNLIGNIALISYKEIERKFISSTLSERIMQFGFTIAKDKIRQKTDMTHKGNPKRPQIKLRQTEIKISRKEKKRIYSWADRLTPIAHYEKNSMRPDEMIQAFLCGHAILNGRNKITKNDYKILQQVFQHFERVI